MFSLLIDLLICEPQNLCRGGYGVNPHDDRDAPRERADGVRPYRSSRIKGMDMHLGPPRPLLSSLHGMVCTVIPLSSRMRLVT